MPNRRTLLYPSDATAGPPPDHLRCRKNDGKRWRCPMPSLPSQILCQHHHAKQRHSLAKHKALLLVAAAAAAPAPQSPPALQLPADSPPSKRRRRREPVDEGEGVVLALEVPKGAAFGRPAVAETRDLENGVMTISPAPARVLGERGLAVDRKVGFDEGVIWKRSVRSKNVEPVPVGPVKKFPFISLGVVKRKKKRTCHRCGTKAVAIIDRCMKCKKVYFCSNCLSEGFQQLSVLEAKTSCPVCRGVCNCETCLPLGVKNRSIEDVYSAHKDVNGIGIKHLNLPIPQNLSEQKQIIQCELNELEIEAVDQGRRFSYIKFPVGEHTTVNCNNCKISLGGFHRSCSNCTYKLCLSCSGQLRNGKLHDLVKNGKTPKTLKVVFKNSAGVQQIPSKRLQPEKSSLTSESKDEKGQSQSMSCPAKVQGGCNDGNLRLVFMMPFGCSNDVNHREEVFV